VDIVPGTRLHALIGADSTEVNSFHHQAVERPAPGLIVSARSDNGIIEAVEAPDRRFFLGVQWHPEHLSGSAANAIRGLIEAAMK
jgi:putative glutamine amidotransferase